MLDRVAGNADKLTDQDHLKMIKYLLEHGANKVINYQDPIQHTTIYVCDSGHLDTFKYLENKVDKKDFNMYIGVAIRHNHMDIIEYIWSKYKDYTTTDNGDTALHYAVWSGKLESVKYLCEHGADINATNDRGETPLVNTVYNTIDITNYLYEQVARTQLPILGQSHEVPHDTDSSSVVLIYSVLVTMYGKPPFSSLSYIAAMRQWLSYKVSIFFSSKK